MVFSCVSGPAVAWQGIRAYLGLTGEYLKYHDPLWKLAQALFEVLPRDTEDWKLTNALLSERETLRMEEKRLELKEDTLFNPLEGR